MKQKLVIFDAAEVLQLLCHYSDGKDIPLDFEVLSVGVSQFLPRWLGWEVLSDKWESGSYLKQFDALSPLHIRYDGKKIMTMSEHGIEPTWREANNELQ